MGLILQPQLHVGYSRIGHGITNNANVKASYSKKKRWKQVDGRTGKDLGCPGGDLGFRSRCAVWELREMGPLFRERIETAKLSDHIFIYGAIVVPVAIYPHFLSCIH